MSLIEAPKLVSIKEKRKKEKSCRGWTDHFSTHCILVTVWWKESHLYAVSYDRGRLTLFWTFYFRHASLNERIKTIASLKVLVTSG